MISWYKVCRNALVCVALACAAVPGHAQLVLAPVGVDVQGFTEPGYYVVAPLQQDTLVFVDDYGRPLFHKRVGLHINVQTYRNSYVTHFAGTQRTRYFVRRDARLQPIDTFRIQGHGIADFHEGKVWTDTSFILLGFETVTMDLSTIVPGGQTQATVLVGVIQEQTFDGRVVFEWKSINHIPVTDATADIDLTQSFIDYIHINSIWREPDGNLLVSCRHTDEVMKIDRKSGAVIWRFGGSASKRNQFRFLNDTTNGFTGFSHQHTAFRTSRGTLMLFDNGNLKPAPQRSRIVEYAIDEGARTARRIWQFTADSVGFIQAMGNVEELPGGNLVIGYGNESGSILAHEIDRDRGIVCTIRNITSAAVNPYRVIKTTIGMSAVLDTIITPGTYGFADRDSSTGIALDIRSASGRHIVSAERHHIAPPAMTFSDRVPEHVLPLRLAVRFRDPDSVQRLIGQTRIDARILPNGVAPARVSFYRRDTVGRGSFRRATASFDSASRSFLINGVFTGELIAALDVLAVPQVLSPRQGDTVASDAAVVRVGLEAGISSCEFRLWPDVAGADTHSVRAPVSADGMAFHVFDRLERGQSYRWSAAAVGSRSVGSATSTVGFVTDMQGILRSGVDPLMPTMDQPVGPVLVKWLGAEASHRCLIQVSAPTTRDHVGVRFYDVPIDTLEQNLGTAIIRADTPGLTYYVRIASLSDDASSAWSDTIGICTAPLPEQALIPRTPAIGQRNVPTSGRVTFTTSDLYDEYEVIISTGLNDPQPRRFVADTPGVVSYSDLEPDRQYFWRVVARGPFSDSGAVGMFVTGTTSDVNERPMDDQPRVSSVTHFSDGLLAVEAADSPASILLVDICGRVTTLPFTWSGGSAMASIPGSVPGWKAVIIHLRDGSITRAVVPLR